MSWKDKLSTSEVNLVQQIVDQVPEAMGGRNAFVACLDKMAESSDKPQFRYVIAADGDVQGTNEESVAREYANDDNYVVDVIDAKWLVSEDASDDTDLTEAS